jgi:hypothetical protein
MAIFASINSQVTGFNVVNASGKTAGFDVCVRGFGSVCTSAAFENIISYKQEQV